MRISDWSSDVCSSDLRALQPVEIEHRVDVVFKVAVALDEVGHRHVAVTALALGPGDDDVAANLRVALAPAHEVQQRLAGVVVRSEEHTSELQSLMRISYAVFCLKKKTHTKATDITD